VNEALTNMMSFLLTLALALVINFMIMVVVIIGRSRFAGFAGFSRHAFQFLQQQ
jgi:hypothetical protein